MHFTDIFIKRPVLAAVVSLMILLLGLRAWTELNVRQYPEMKNAVVTIATTYVGADAELIQGFITTPIEREIASAQGIDYIQSASLPGASSIQVYLRLDYDPNEALTQIAAKVNKVRRDLPQGSEDPVIELSVGETIAAMYLSFYSTILDNNQITDYLVRVIEPRLSTLPGVQRALIIGDRTFAMRIWLKPERMAALNLTASDVQTALQANNVQAAVGATKGSMVSVDLKANTDLQTTDEFRNLVIRSEGDAIVRLGDVSTWCWAPKRTTPPSRSTARAPRSSASSGAGRQLARRGRARARGVAGHRSAVAGGSGSEHPLRQHALYPQRHQRSGVHARGSGPDRDRGDLPVPRVAPFRDHPCGYGAIVDHRRFVPDVGDGLFHQPAHVVGHGVGHRHGGGRCHHRAGEYPSPHRGRHETV
jgi:hypothetical protein